MNKTFLQILLLTLPLYSTGQSFIATINNDTIYFSSLAITDDFIRYKETEETSEKKIDIEDVKGYYASSSNKFYHRKFFKDNIQTGFLKLKNEERNLFDFVELVFEGKINVYRTIDYSNPNSSSIYNYWFFEKNDRFAKVFSADKDIGDFKIKKAKFYGLNQELLQSIFADDETALTAVIKLGKRGKLKEIRQIVNDYNNRHFVAKTDSDNAASKGEVIFLRDSRKELKDELILHVDGKKYKFGINSKLKINIPATSNKVCIENSLNN